MQKSELEFSFLVKTIEIANIIGLVLLWVLVVINYSKLPNSVPIHFDFSGRPDNFGEKDSVFLMPLVASVIFIFLTFKTKSPQSVSKFRLSLPKKIAPNTFSTDIRLYVYVKLILVVFFSLLEIKTFQIAAGKAESLGGWFIPLAIGMFHSLCLFQVKTIQFQLV